jgi:hypothetical protein
MESADEIRTQVKALHEFCLKKDNVRRRKEDMDGYKQYCMQTFTNVHQKYPTLFFKIVEEPSSFPMYRLEELLQMKKKIEKNESTEEEVSKELGQKYYDEFVKDNLPKKSS